MDGFRPAPCPALVMVIALAALLGGCSGGDESPTSPPAATVEIQITGEPLVTYSPTTGKTTTVVQFIARDRAGNPLDPADVTVELAVDGKPVDNESLLQEDAEELSSSIHLGLVLDASYSMMLHSPAAFGPMRVAARDAVVDGLTMYAGRPGTFTWTASWFAETIFSPAVVGRTWQPDDLLTIPEPSPGTATKLFAAVQRQARKMQERHATTANGPHDHHMMIVLSDGADNYSWFDNGSFATTGVTTSGAPYDVNGWSAATLDSATAAIAAHPKLTVHVLGLGSDVRDDQLAPLVTTGGRYLKNPSSSQLGHLFDQLAQEFATIQNHGATIPLPPGDYTFRLRVRTVRGGARDDYEFRFHAGDGSARVLP